MYIFSDNSKSIKKREFFSRNFEPLFRNCLHEGVYCKKPRARQMADPGLKLTVSLTLIQDNFPENRFFVLLNFDKINSLLMIGKIEG